MIKNNYRESNIWCTSDQNLKIDNEKIYIGGAVMILAPLGGLN